MWKSVGGQAYGSPYSGPIGAVITPLLEGPSSPSSRDLPFMSSLCGACGEAYQTQADHLTEPVDVMSDWLDACEADGGR